jgi:hypothetical protein
LRGLYYGQCQFQCSQRNRADVACLQCTACCPRLPPLCGYLAPGLAGKWPRSGRAHHVPRGRAAPAPPFPPWPLWRAPPGPSSAGSHQSSLTYLVRHHVHTHARCTKHARAGHRSVLKGGPKECCASPQVAGAMSLKRTARARGPACCPCTR